MKAIPRIVMGLVALATGLLLVFDVALRLFPGEADIARETRGRIVQALAIQVAAQLQAQDLRALERTLQGVQARDPEVQSIGLRRADGVLLAHAGEHLQRWRPERAGTLDALKVDIGSDRGRWGALEVTFRPLHARGAAWLLSGPVPVMLLFGLFGSVLFYLYLRRMLQHLDPASAVPERVRTAFDTLSEGVVVLDAKGRVLLANRSFVALAPPGVDGAPIGTPLADVRWLVRGPADDGLTVPPWETALRTRQTQRGAAYRVVTDGRVTASLSVNCSPLLDERDVVRGCIVTLVDLTELERSHEQLLDALTDLAASKQELEIKAHELEVMATHDALSGCLNRRALFERAEALMAEAQAQQRPLACVMADMDHFKSINDRLGHAAGDDAIRLFAALLRENVRALDLVGRYGGEEFCLVLPGVDARQAAAVAERIREQVADSGGVGPDSARMRLSASFGVASLAAGAASLAELLEQADQAMYAAKQGGRNRVVVHGAADRAAAAPAAEPTGAEEVMA